MNNIVQMSHRQANKAFIYRNYGNDTYTSFNTKLDSFRKNKTMFDNAIREELLKYRKINGIPLSNAQIAKAVGCSIRTVRRATKKLHDTGLIKKKHKHARSLNKYCFHVKFVSGPRSHKLFREELSPLEQDIYAEDGIEGLARHRRRLKLVPLLSEEEYTMAKVSTPDQEINFQRPLSPKATFEMTELYKPSKDLYSSNGNDESFYVLNKPYNDLSEIKKMTKPVTKDIRPNVSEPYCSFCWDCWRNKLSCTCDGEVKVDKKIWNLNVPLPDAPRPNGKCTFCFGCHKDLNKCTCDKEVDTFCLVCFNNSSSCTCARKKCNT